MIVREEVIRTIRASQPDGQTANKILDDGTVLKELGFTSLHLITLLLELQQRFGIDVDRFVESGEPMTVGELVTTVEACCQPVTAMRS
jgi:acyl carrier protein